MSYQTGKALPYFIKRWVFWQKDAVLPELYDFSEVEAKRKAARRELEAAEKGGEAKLEA